MANSVTAANSNSLFPTSSHTYLKLTRLQNCARPTLKSSSVSRLCVQNRHAGIFHAFHLPLAAQYRSRRPCVDQGVKEARNLFRLGIRRGLPAAPARAAKSAHPNPHPEFVHLVFSSTNLV
jgi:hypothetical protein